MSAREAVVLEVVLACERQAGRLLDQVSLVRLHALAQGILENTRRLGLIDETYSGSHEIRQRIILETYIQWIGEPDPLADVQIAELPNGYVHPQGIMGVDRASGPDTTVIRVEGTNTDEIDRILDDMRNAPLVRIDGPTVVHVNRQTTEEEIRRIREEFARASAERPPNPYIQNVTLNFEVGPAEGPPCITNPKRVIEP
jgi:hypothetical protein